MMPPHATNIATHSDHCRRLPVSNLCVRDAPSTGNSRKSRRRKLSFSALVQIVSIESTSDYSDDEVSATWYDLEELQTFKRDRLKTAELWDQQNREGLCLRGSENHTRKGSKRRNSNIARSIQAVLEEQDMQDLDEVENADMLAHIYRIHTAKAQAAARDRGLKDHEDAMSSV